MTYYCLIFTKTLEIRCGKVLFCIELNTHMRLKEFAKMGYSTATMRYPYRVKTKNGKVELVRDPSKGLKK